MLTMNLDEVRSKVEEVIKLMGSFATEVEKENTRSGSLDELESNLNKKKEELDKWGQKITDEETRLKSERDFLVKNSAEQRKKQEMMDKRTAEINLLNMEYDKKKQELQEMSVQINTKIESYKETKTLIEEKEKDLEKREARLVKEQAIDRERKENLDVREAKIKEREAYLQRVMQS